MAILHALALLATALAVPAQAPPVIDNNQVRAAVTTVPPQGTAPGQQASTNGVTIFLDAGSAKLTYGDGRVERRKFQAGEARWTPASGEYTIDNTGSKPLRVVQVELKGQGRPVHFGPLDPVRLAPASYKVLLETVHVRVLRARIGPKQSVPFHEHSLNRVVVYLTDAHLRVTDATGRVTEATGKAGDVRWAGTAKHSEANLAGTVFEVVVVEVK